MKHFSCSQALSPYLKDFSCGILYFLIDIQIDCSYLLAGAMKKRAVLFVPDDCFEDIIKYWADVEENERFVFIPPIQKNGSSVPTFSSSAERHWARARALLSRGVDRVSFIICASSSAHTSLVGMPGDTTLVVDSDFNFENCVLFLQNNDYRLADLVTISGEYAVRGGIVDIFPFARARPVRVSFIDDEVVISEFDVETQLTSSVVKDFSIVPQGSPSLFPFWPSVSASFISLIYGEKPNIEGSNNVSFSFKNIFKRIDYNSFLNNDLKKFPRIFFDEDLSSVGLSGFNNKIIIPSWFINSRKKNIIIHSSAVQSPLNVSNIKKGDFLVHRDFGISVYGGLFIDSSTTGNTQEFVLLKYGDGGVVRLDTGRLDLVDFYADADSGGVVLDFLNKTSVWKKKVSAAKRRADVAVDYLLNLYIKRRDIKRDPFVSDVEMEHDFIAAFPYADTEDQAVAWDEISTDLSSATPMDRLLCGDVGFGKTELAMRASFRCVLSNKRVVVLAPTTILVNQLYSSFNNRLGRFGVSVDMISRFRTTAQSQIIKKMILNNKNDILIGTHAVLNNDIYLKNIGLLIVDEEHRFGVSQKERLKTFKEKLDVLSMSATPIPRSMNLALAGLYSISLLQTPPLMRRPIVTSIKYYNDKLISAAIVFEVSRGGQVFFVHNDVLSIQHITNKLQEAHPDYNILFVHGQESSKNIEKTMSLFVEGGVDVLVCTSIIEAGIDVENANCIIINNSHLFGLSQLYQIRGRVGRGSRQAYAYLLIPQKMLLSTVAHSRLNTIVNNTRLGSGYSVAISDLEIRGGGYLFGYKQSGGGGVGYDMYLRLINRSLHESVRPGPVLPVLLEDVSVSIYQKRCIPIEYVSAEDIRLSFYKNLASASSKKDLEDIVYNLLNRFGPLPVPFQNLLKEYRLRLLACEAGVSQISSRGCGIVCKIIIMKSDAFVGAIIDYLKVFLDKDGASFHVLPDSSVGLSLCIHVPEKLDKYTLLSQLLNKFITIK